ncbi:MAG: D-alanine--D-alanine ligase [Caulobacterales bacterium]|nr:D-alanine--D-alanine ligase [Caulobacterales bacterium]
MTQRVAVLLGGLSPEREVSLVSGRACAEALLRKGYDVVTVDATRDLARQLDEARPDIVFNALHGAWGEDGRVQGVLEHVGLPYTHSGVLASALAMDKERAKAVFANAGLDAPRGRLASCAEAAAGHLMDPPYVIKPNAQGSSVGVFIVREGDNRPPAALTDPAWSLGDELLVEEFVSGRELTVTVMGDRGALAVTEIIPNAQFYDYEAKYAEGGSRHVVPAEIPPAVAERALRAAETAHDALGCRGLTRSDFIYDSSKDRLAILEVNSQPGMTPTSLAPEQAGHCGIAFDDLVAWIAEDASCPR